MNGSNIIADTSLLVNFFNGMETAKTVLEGRQIWIASITEIELLSYSKLSGEEVKLIRSFLKKCMTVELTQPIRDVAITIRKNHSVKVPDAIIAATSVHLGFPLVTMDNDFKKVKNLNSVILQ